MLDKQEYNSRQETLPLSSQKRQINNVQKRGKGRKGGSGMRQENELRETGIWSEAVLMQNFESIIEKLDGKREARRQARRNVVDDEGKCFMAEVFEKRLERARRGKFTFLLVGHAGAGRANPVNALLGEEIVPGDEPKHDTLQVITYKQKDDKYSIIDTPGLCDRPAEYRKDYVYVARLEDGAPRFDGLWFVTPLLEVGLTDGEKRAIELITRAYGRDAWRYSLIVLTYAQTLEQGYQRIYQEKMECVRQEIARLTGAEIAAEIPAVGVASSARIVPDCKEWLSELYLAVSMRMSDQGYLSFLLTTARRLKFSLLKSGGRTTQSIRIPVCVANQPLVTTKDQEGYIYIDEEKGRQIEQRMQDYLTNVAKRKSMAPN